MATDSEGVGLRIIQSWKIERRNGFDKASGHGNHDKKLRSNMPPNPSSPVLPVYDETDLQTRCRQMKGNASLDVRRHCLLLLQSFVSTPDKSYGANVGQRLELVELNVWDGPSRMTGSDKERPKAAQTVFEITVNQEMINSLGVLHGGCAAYLIDPCSASSIMTVGILSGKVDEFIGFSQSMNIIWHQPVKLGTKIRIVSTSMAVNGKIKTARCEVWNGDLLCISATHSMAKPRKRTASKEQGKL